MLSIKRKLSISIKWIFLEKRVKSQQSRRRRETRNVSKNVLFQKEVQLYFDHIALGKVEAGVERNEHTVTFNK